MLSKMPLLLVFLGALTQHASNYNPVAEWGRWFAVSIIFMGVQMIQPLTTTQHANVDDGSCIYDIPGCTDPSANKL